jgi:uncharacterized protein (DUF4415 family)
MSSGSQADRRSDWRRVDTLDEAAVLANAVSDVDNPPALAEFWRRARLVVPRRKQPITIRLDPDVLVWFRLQKGYQTRINAILRTYMSARWR